MLFVEIYAERQIWVYELPFGEVKGSARRWLMAQWKAHGQLSTL